MNPTCVVDGAVIDYEDTGAGSVVVFVHGVYVSGAIWHRVVAALEAAPGASSQPGRWVHTTVRSGVDLSAAATARRIIGFLEALDLQGVTLVANDTVVVWCWQHSAIPLSIRRGSAAWSSPTVTVTSTSHPVSFGYS